MTDNLLEVTTRDGKYTVIQAPHGGMTFKRHGEDWEVANRDFSGVGLILALAQDLEAANKVVLTLLKWMGENQQHFGPKGDVDFSTDFVNALEEWDEGRTVK